MNRCKQRREKIRNMKRSQNMVFVEVGLVLSQVITWCQIIQMSADQSIRRRTHIKTHAYKISELSKWDENAIGRWRFKSEGIYTYMRVCIYIYICIYILLTHFIVQWKLIQHYKPIILQLKRNKMKWWSKNKDFWKVCIFILKQLG